MNLLGPSVETLKDALSILRRTSFPGMSDDEADMFKLGFWSGAMALAIEATTDAISAEEIAGRVEAEVRRIEAGADEPE